MNLRFTTVDENGHIMSQTMPRGQRSGIVWCRKPETEFDLGVPRHHSLSLPSTQSRIFTKRTPHGLKEGSWKSSTSAAADLMSTRTLL